MKKYRVYQVDAFTAERFRGNPAGVVSNADGLTVGQMQTIARELNNSETAFILSPSSDDHEVWVRFFTPTMEVPSCGHATVSAHYVRAVENDLPSSRVIQKIGAGILPVDIIREDGDYRIIMTQGRIEFSDIDESDRASIVSALGLEDAEIDRRCPIEIGSTGHSKVLVGIRNRNSLHSLKPDMTRLTAISGKIGCNGYYVFTLDSESDVLAHGRMFAPAIGINEDPVTGNANGPLGAYLIKHGIVEASGSPFSFSARQGEAIGRTGTVEVEVDHDNRMPARVRIGGRAVISFKTEIEI